MVKKPRLKRDWEGRYVRLKHGTQTNGGAMFSAGEVLRVDRNYGGLWLSTVRLCSECKQRRRDKINRVQERDVELLPEDYVPEENPSSVDALRDEIGRLREACLQVREWGIELASLQPAAREQRFIVLWQDINQTLRTAVQEIDKVTEQEPWKETKIEVYGPGNTAVQIAIFPPRGMGGIMPVKRFTVELDQTLTDEEGVTWRYADWHGYRMMSRLTALEQAKRDGSE